MRNIVSWFSALHYRVRQKDSEEEDRSREYMEDRMQAILSLKDNIETNKVGWLVSYNCRNDINRD